MSRFAPQKQRDLPSGDCVGSMQPALYISYFQAVRARSRRCSVKSASVTLQEATPCSFEIYARLGKVCRGAVPTFASMRHRIERAGPLPLIDTHRHARSPADGADLNITVEDAPTLMAGVRVSVSIAHDCADRHGAQIVNLLRCRKGQSHSRS